MVTSCCEDYFSVTGLKDKSIKNMANLRENLSIMLMISGWGRCLLFNKTTTVKRTQEKLCENPGVIQADSGSEPRRDSGDRDSHPTLFNLSIFFFFLKMFGRSFQMKGAPCF